MNEIVIEEGEHSPIGPSSAHRWMQCAGSVFLPQKEKKREASGAAWDGTVCHAVASSVLNGEAESVDACIGLPIRYEGVLTGKKFTKKLAKRIRFYIEHCNRAIAGKNIFWSEILLSLEEAGFPNVFGTVDFVAWDKDRQSLYVVDLKTGKWPVRAEYNLQLSIYALAAMYMIHREFGVKAERVAVAIAQPGAQSNRVDFWRPVRTYWRGFHGDLKEALERIGLAEQNPEDYLVEGEWCRFCPAKNACPLKGVNLKVTRSGG